MQRFIFSTVFFPNIVRHFKLLRIQHTFISHIYALCLNPWKIKCHCLTLLPSGTLYLLLIRKLIIEACLRCSCTNMYKKSCLVYSPIYTNLHGYFCKCELRYYFDPRFCSIIYIYKLFDGDL